MKNKENGLVAKIGGKAKTLLVPNDKDLEKIRKKAENLKKEYEIYDLAARFLENPDDEEIKKEVVDLDEASAKKFKSIMESKKKFAIVAAGALTLVTVGAIVVGKSAKKRPVDVDYEEVEDEDDDVEDDDSVDETDDTPVEE